MQEGDSKAAGEVSFDLEEEEGEADQEDDPQNQYSDFINKHDYGLQDDDEEDDQEMEDSVD